MEFSCWKVPACPPLERSAELGRWAPGCVGGSKAFPTPTPSFCLPLEPHLPCLSCPTWPRGQLSTACRDPFTWTMLLTETEHSPNCPSLDTRLLLAELIKPLCPLKDPDSQGKRKMLFKTSLLCRPVCVQLLSNAVLHPGLGCPWPSLVCAQTHADTRTLLGFSTPHHQRGCCCSHASSVQCSL